MSCFLLLDVLGCCFIFRRLVFSIMDISHTLELGLLGVLLFSPSKFSVIADWSSRSSSFMCSSLIGSFWTLSRSLLLSLASWTTLLFISMDLLSWFVFVGSWWLIVLSNYIIWQSFDAWFSTWASGLNLLAFRSCLSSTSFHATWSQLSCYPFCNKFFT